MSDANHDADPMVEPAGAEIMSVLSSSVPSSPDSTTPAQELAISDAGDGVATETTQDADSSPASESEAEGDEESDSEGFPKVDGERFPLFELLPMETQIRIFTEAIRKPNIHFVRLQRTVDRISALWRVRMQPFPKSKDKSSFRYLRKLSKVCFPAAAAVRLSTVEKARLPFYGKVSGGIDASCDLVCFTLQSKGPKALSSPWNPQNQSLLGRFTMDRVATAAQFVGLRHIAVRYGEYMGTCDSFEAEFRCFVDRGPIHSSYVVCPEEFAGFLDCFVDLEVVYIILYADRTAFGKLKARHYARKFFALSSDERAARGLEIFHAADRKYIEVPQDREFMGLKYGPSLFEWENSALDMLADTRRELTLDCPPLILPPSMQYYVSRKTRMGLQYKILLEVPN